ncbi:MAG: YfhO family protein [Clostridia bacterium]|nr:YfhO family protein [Clostridia bacterium]
MTTANPLSRRRKNYFLRTFLWALGVAFLCFLPWMIFNDGYFFFYGDYNVQQIPFHQMIHDSIRDGNIGWSYTTDLGANIIGSYSFYMFGSPFFWAMLPFPSAVVPYLLAPMLMLKFALAALGGYTFLRRYVKNQNYAVFGAMIYAFSGFGIYNIFFNHFHEAMVIFPFMLAAVDEFIYEKKKGAVGLAIFAASLMNYYFFAGQAVFIFIYWLIRMYTGSFRMTFKEFLRFAVEVVLGFAASGVIMVPSVLAVIQNSRVFSSFSGWSSLVYTSEQRYIHILESFFFPPDMPAYANFTPDSNAKWASVAGWLPLFSMVGVFAFYSVKKHRWLRLFIPVLFVMAYVPIFNGMFQLLNAAYYARWFYMLTLMLALATAMAFDDEKTDFKPGLRLTFVITAAIAILIGFMPTTSKNSKGETVTDYGLEKYPDRFWIWVAIAVAGLCALMIIMNLRRKPKVFIRTTAVVLTVIIVGYANVLIGTGVLNASYKKDYIVDYVMNGKDAFPELEDLHDVRSDFYNDIDNIGMFWQVPTIQAFQSIVPGSVMDYYKSVGVERTVGSRPKTDVYAIRSFLSVKYLFDNTYDKKEFGQTENHNLMPGWKLKEEANGFKVYENQYFIPYGFTYDTYVTEKEYEDCDESDRSKLMLKSIVLTDEQIEKYKDFLKHDEKLSSYTYSQQEYFTDCEDRKKLTCSYVDFYTNGFDAEIKTGDSPELVVFTVPYESGWTAEVNGKPAEIEKVDVGFMAVKVPANTNSSITFTYQTPGLMIGLIVSGAGIVLFILYMILWRVPKRRKDGTLALTDDLAPANGGAAAQPAADEAKNVQPEPEFKGVSWADPGVPDMFGDTSTGGADAAGPDFDTGIGTGADTTSPADDIGSQVNPIWDFGDPEQGINDTDALLTDIEEKPMTYEPERIIEKPARNRKKKSKGGRYAR